MEGQKPSRPNQPPQRNAGRRPTSGGSPAAETSSSFGPRVADLNVDLGMKARTLPDWFAPVFAWIITFVVLGVAATQPEGIYVSRGLRWLPPLLAVAWTSGFVGMLRFKKKFREEHEALGSPQLFGSPYEGRHWRFVGYLFGFRFLRLGDPVVSAGFSVFVALTVVALIGLLLLFGIA